MGPRGNPGPSTVQRPIGFPGFRVVSRSAMTGDVAVASFASKTVLEETLAKNTQKA